VNELTAEHVGLRDAVAALLAKRSDSAAVRKAIETPRGYDEGLWSVLCEQIGVAGLAIPERFGGAGACLLETHLVLLELGRTLTPSPLLGSAVLAGQLLLALGDEAACQRLLPAIADGTSVASVCWAAAAGHWDPRSGAVEAAGSLLTGECHYVLDGDIADVLLVLARDADAVAVFEVDPRAPGVIRTHTPTMDRTRRLASVQFDGAPARRIGTADAVEALARVRDIGCVALSAEQVGAAARILEMTVEYTKLRVQFGRPIGSFQALKHRMADLHVLVEAARSASFGAVDSVVPAAVAKAYCSEAFFTVAAEAIQLHGGIAITWEHDAHLYFKRAHASAQLFGAPGEHLVRMAAMAGLEQTP
jgi:alkylation response protein AidB-like acyl-CoA dehydrogenase